MCVCVCVCVRVCVCVCVLCREVVKNYVYCARSSFFFSLSSFAEINLKSYVFVCVVFAESCCFIYLTYT